MSTTDTVTLLRAPDPQHAVRALCHRALQRVEGHELREELTRIVAALERPLQLAVAGMLSAGKSTLINAVLGRPVAPVDAGECTTIVTWYEYGDDDGVVIVERRNGPPLRRSLENGRLPADLGCAAADVDRLRVRLREPLLRDVTVIDTPGTNTVTAQNEAATRRLLFGDAAAEHAQALLYVLRHVQRFDADTLTEFRDLTGAAGMTAVNTAAVLSNIDRFDDAQEPWRDARRVCDKAFEALRDSVLDVAPVAGLLAETGRARLLGGAELAALHELAATDEDTFEDQLLEVDRFAAGSATRRTLVERLHKYGIRVAVEYLRTHPGADLDDLHRALADRSGYGGPERSGAASPSSTAEIVDRFTRHARRLKAHGAMVRIRRIGRIPASARDAAVVRELLDSVHEGRRLAAGLEALRILAAGSALSHGGLQLNADMSAELMRMVREDDAAAQMGLPPGSPPAAIAQRAREASARWRRVALAAGPTVAGRRAHDVLDVLEAMVANLTDPQADAGPPPSSPSPPSPPPSGQAPVPPLGNRERLARLAGLGPVTATERDALTALAGARTVAAAVGLGPAAGPAAIRAAAASLARSFRALQNRTLLPARERALAREVCALYEQIAQMDLAPPRRRSS